MSDLNRFRDEYECVYQAEVCDQIFIWRELTKDEFEKAKRYYPNEEEREEFVCRLCVLSPSDFDYSDCYAGIPTTLTRLILNESGFTDTASKNMLTQYRAEMSDFENQIAPIICAAFPMFSLEDVEKWTIRKTIRYLTRAEWMLITVHGSPMRIADEDTPVDIEDFPELKKEAMLKKKMQGRPREV